MVRQNKAMLTLAIAVLWARAASPPSRRMATRRRVMSLAAPASALALAGAAGAEVINRPLCSSGVGDGCDALAVESALIKELQSRSAAKRDVRAREAVERYSVNNFNDYFSAAFPPRALVRHANGTFEALTQDVVQKGLSEGTIKYAIPKGASGVSGYSTTRTPFEFAEEPPVATTPGGAESARVPTP